MSLIAAAHQASQSNSSEGAILTLAIPLGVFCAMLLWGFFQRRPVR